MRINLVAHPYMVVSCLGEDGDHDIIRLGGRPGVEYRHFSNLETAADTLLVNHWKTGGVIDTSGNGREPRVMSYTDVEKYQAQRLYMPRANQR